MRFTAHFAYAIDPPAFVMSIVSAPKSAKNKIRPAFAEICSMKMFGSRHSPSIVCSRPTPAKLNW